MFMEYRRELIVLFDNITQLVSQLLRFHIPYASKLSLYNILYDHYEVLIQGIKVIVVV